MYKRTYHIYVLDVLIQLQKNSYPNLNNGLSEELSELYQAEQQIIISINSKASTWMILFRRFGFEVPTTNNKLQHILTLIFSLSYIRS
jgi:hypothetical protein